LKKCCGLFPCFSLVFPVGEKRDTERAKPTPLLTYYTLRETAIPLFQPKSFLARIKLRQGKSKFFGTKKKKNILLKY